jgi:hypothetical protein
MEMQGLQTSILRKKTRIVSTFLLCYNIVRNLGKRVALDKNSCAETDFGSKRKRKRNNLTSEERTDFLHCSRRLLDGRCQKKHLLEPIAPRKRLPD